MGFPFQVSWFQNKSHLRPSRVPSCCSCQCEFPYYPKSQRPVWSFREYLPWVYLMYFRNKLTRDRESSFLVHIFTWSLVSCGWKSHSVAYRSAMWHVSLVSHLVPCFKLMSRYYINSREGVTCLKPYLDLFSFLHCLKLSLFHTIKAFVLSLYWSTFWHGLRYMEFLLIKKKFCLE